MLLRPRAPRLAAVSLVVGLLAAVLPTAGAQADTANLVKNPSFSSGTTGWKVTDTTSGVLGTATISSNPAALLRSTKTGATVALNDATSTVVAGKAGVTYTATARVRSSQAKLSGQLRVREVVGTTAVSHTSNFYLTASNTWQSVSLTSPPRRRQAISTSM